jgi:IrrE N-terminal-like domain
MAAEIGQYEARAIDQRIERILRDLGDPQPPLRLEPVFALLKLDLNYYRADDVGALAEFAHRIRMAGKQLAARPALALDALRKAKLSALWVPDGKRIFIDESVPKPKHRWIQGHEITHGITEWHQTFLFGDNTSTLDQECYEQLEAEANYGAGRLLFLRDRFSGEARDCQLNFESIKLLKDRYGNTVTSTFWRMVEDRDPSSAVFGLVSQHPHYPEIGEGRDGQPWRDFPRSPAFRTRFSRITPAQVFDLIGRHATNRKRGPVIAGTDVMADDNGIIHEVRLEGFCNTYSVMTLGMILKVRPTIA